MLYTTFDNNSYFNDYGHDDDAPYEYFLTGKDTTFCLN